MHVGGFFNWMQRDGFLNGPGVQITAKNLSLLSIVVKEKSAHLKNGKKSESVKLSIRRLLVTSHPFG